jgi:hypothetical protein
VLPLNRFLGYNAPRRRSQKRLERLESLSFRHLMAFFRRMKKRNDSESMNSLWKMHKSIQENIFMEFSICHQYTCKEENQFSILQAGNQNGKFA